MGEEDNLLWVLLEVEGAELVLGGLAEEEGAAVNHQTGGNLVGSNSTSVLGTY